MQKESQPAFSQFISGFAVAIFILIGLVLVSVLL